LKEKSLNIIPGIEERELGCGARWDISLQLCRKIVVKQCKKSNRLRLNRVVIESKLTRFCAPRRIYDLTAAAERICGPPVFAQ